MKKLLNVIPMGRITEPADVANAAWYLASDASSFVTGILLEVYLTLALKPRTGLTEESTRSMEDVAFKTWYWGSQERAVLC